MIVRTLNSTYEVERNRRRFRQVGRVSARGAREGWQPFVRMGAVVVGEPLHFFTDAKPDARAPGTAEVWTTTPSRAGASGRKTRLPAAITNRSAVIVSLPTSNVRAPVNRAC